MMFTHKTLLHAYRCVLLHDNYFIVFSYIQKRSNEFEVKIGLIKLIGLLQVFTHDRELVGSNLNNLNSLIRRL